MHERLPTQLRQQLQRGAECPAVLQAQEGAPLSARAASSTSVGRSELSAGVLRTPASDAPPPADSQSSPCTPRLQRAASDALSDCSGLPCVSCGAAGGPDAPASGKGGDGGAALPALPHRTRGCSIASAPPSLDAGGKSGFGGECPCSCIPAASAAAGHAAYPAPDARAASARGPPDEGGHQGPREGFPAALPQASAPVVVPAPPVITSAPAGLGFAVASGAWAGPYAGSWALDAPRELLAGSLGGAGTDGGFAALPVASAWACAPARAAAGATREHAAPGGTGGVAKALTLHVRAGAPAGGSRWADELPDDLLRGVLARMPPAHLRVSRLADWACAAGVLA